MTVVFVSGLPHGRTSIASENPRDSLPLTEESQTASPDESLTSPGLNPSPIDELLPDTLPEGAISGRTIDLTLPDLLNLTLQQNRDLQNATLERIIQRQQLNAAEQTFDPRFTPVLGIEVTQNLSASGAGFVETEEGLRLFNDATDIEERALLNTTLSTRQGTDIRVGIDPLENSRPVQFQVTQPLLRGFGQAVNEAPVNQARLQERQNQLTLRETTITTLTTAITSYTRLISAQSQVEIQTRALQRRQEELDIQRALVEAGRQAPFNLFETERSVADAERGLANAQNQLQQANNAILNLIGTDQNLRFIASEETIDQLFVNAVDRAATYDQETLIELALELRPDYRQAQLQRRRLELEQLLAEDDLRWQLNAVADGNLGNFSESTLGLIATRTFDDPQLQTDRTRSEVNLQQQDNTLAQLEETIRNDVIAGLGDVRSNLLRVKAAERATINARRQLEVARTQFRLGRGNVTQFQLLDQEDQLVRAQNEELEAQAAFLNGIAQLEQTVGITLESWSDQINLKPILTEIEADSEFSDETVIEE